MRREPARWSGPLRALHWLMAALILGMIGVGWSMTHLRFDLGMTFELYQWHKSWGLVVGILLLARLLARGISTPPPPIEHSRAERQAARAAHVALYIFMAALPVSGWLMAAASPLALPTRPFELFTLPAPVEPDEALFVRLRQIHEILAYGLLALVLLHVAASLKHQFVDRAGIFRRITF